ncbi:MAG: hypothetical protein ACJ8JD_04370, partial [Chthoniobacterales bacterium]
RILAAADEHTDIECAGPNRDAHCNTADRQFAGSDAADASGGKTECNAAIDGHRARSDFTAAEAVASAGRRSAGGKFATATSERDDLAATSTHPGDRSDCAANPFAGSASAPTGDSEAFAITGQRYSARGEET